ncbi:hypothetical protein AV926_05540 [Myroides marinus]|uniref:Uncharacterized protein n=1 Tax=Myroides marinus TaxID=703342 RepID=A0A164A5S9_9FLAO|nr:hypothetical protein [Myroides marinus]KZE83008.1 hypothetical protein AV926_05540 [Myroides marinus]
MKKYLLFLIAILSVSLTSCSVDDDCDNGFYRVDQFGPANGYFPEDLIINGMTGESSILITSERQFLQEVRGARNFLPQIDFSRENLLIGQVRVRDFRNLASSVSLFKESCNYTRDNEVVITLDVNKGIRNSFLTYNAILPKTSNTKMFVRVDVIHR